jgi:hypothetical protein
MGFLSVASLMAVLFISCTALVLLSDQRWSELDAAHLTLSQLSNGDSTAAPGLGEYLLCFVRCIFAFIGWYAIQHIVFDKKGLKITVMDSKGELKPLFLIGMQRLTTFTVWCWVLLSSYFAIAALCSIMVLFLDAQVPVFMARVACVMYEATFASAYIVTMVVTFVLIPAASKRNMPTHTFFDPIPVLLHNANVIFIGIETLMNRAPLFGAHFPYGQLFGLAYVVFAWYWYTKIGAFYYFFLDYNRPYASVWYLGLFALVICLLSYQS